MVDFILDMDDIQTGLHWIKWRLRSFELVLKIYDRKDGWILRGGFAKKIELVTGRKITIKVKENSLKMQVFS